MFIGTAGNSQSFYDEGHKHTIEAPAWLRTQGLNAFEYSLGRGISLKEGTAQQIGREMQKQGIALSIHAPYFINLAIDDSERIQKNRSYFLRTAEVAKWMGAERVVFHPGAVTKMTRQAALDKAKSFLPRILAQLDAHGFGQLVFCPETMGKINQFGTLEEVIALCQLDERLLPTVDFGHLHARSLGGLQCQDDFARVLDALEQGVGRERTRQMHIHFSRIEFTQQGEKKHHRFADTEYGPEFLPLAELIVQRQLQPHIICESRGTQAEDALEMKAMLQAAGAD